MQNSKHTAPVALFILKNGDRRTVETTVGESLMEAAMEHAVEGIEATCRGALCCATCHVYVDPTWLPRLPGPDEDELDMLGFVAAEQKATSRLSCQIKMTDALDGLVVSIPETQMALQRKSPTQAQDHQSKENEA